MEEFIKYLQYELYRSQHTIKAYQSDLEQFCAFLSSNPESDPESDPSAKSGELQPASVTRDHIRAWIISLAEAGEAPRSLRRKIQSLRAFFKFLCRRKLLSSNPAEELTLPKLPKPLPDFVKDADMESLLCRYAEEAADPNLPRRERFFAARIHLILHMLYATGMRLSEILSLTDDSVSLGARTIRVVGKGRKERSIPIAEPLSEEIRNWQTLRDAEYPDLVIPHPLIATIHGAMSTAQFSRIVKSMLEGKNAGRRSPHTLRHTFATSMLNGGADLNSVRAILGHSSLATTQIYTHLQFSDIRREYGAHPRSARKKEKD